MLVGVTQKSILSEEHKHHPLVANTMRGHRWQIGHHFLAWTHIIALDVGARKKHTKIGSVEKAQEEKKNK